MANYEINEEQEVLTKAMRMIETGDPVHADVYNVLFSALLNNDVFLEKLANKMVQQAMISHVMDSTNSNMVLGADQGPVITKLIDKVQEQVTVLNTKGTVYEKYNVVDAIKGDLVPITTVELPAGNYIIYASNNADNDQAGEISCTLKASSGRLSGMEMRGQSNNGGGLLACAYLTTTTKSTVTSLGYGYNSGDYKYQSLIIAVKL